MKSFPDSVQAGIEFSAELFRKAKRAVVLTGAGISTSSGIPDFRSEGSGLWSHDEPLEIASMQTFRTHPEKFYGWFRPLASQIFEALPNAAHQALAQLEKAGYIHSILTQNIDMLHQKAGTMHMVELHGTLKTLSCTQCFQQVESAALSTIIYRTRNIALLSSLRRASQTGCDSLWRTVAATSVV